MGFIVGILKRIIKIFLYIGVVISVILLLPNLPPYTKFTSIEIDPSQPRTGALSPNGDLNNVEKLYTDKLFGPECFQISNGELYTSLGTGEIVKISHGGHVTFVTQIGQPCVGIVHEHICGRPLGFIIDDKNNQMYVADAYYGIWKVDLKSYKKQLLVSPRKEIEGKKPMLFNSLALAANGDVYWTDSSSEYHLKDGIFAIISDPSGRFFRYNPATNESTVLLDGMWFANGVMVSPDNQFVLVVESNHFRVLKYYIDGPKKGLTEVFVSGLPGTPDTIRALPDGSGVLVSLYAAFDDEHPLLSKSLASTPLARKFLARLMRLLEIPFEFLNKQFPHIVFEQIIYVIGHFESVSGLTPGMSGIVQLDWNGNIVASHYNTDKSMPHISDAIVYNGKLYMGAPHAQRFIASVPAPPLLKKAFDVAKPTLKVKSTPEKQVPQKDKKPAVQPPKVEQTKQNLKVEQPKQNIKVEQPKETKSTQKVSTEKSSPKVEKRETDTQKKVEVNTNNIPKDPIKTVKEDTAKAEPTVTATKPKKEPVTQPPTQKPPSTPTPKTESKKEAAPKPKEVPETKSKESPKVEEKKPVPESKINTDTKPTPAPKADVKKDSSTKTDTKTPQKVEKENKPSGNDQTPPKSDSSKPTPKPGKSSKVKQGKGSKKSAIHDEPQIIVKKVVPDEIPVEEEILSDTAKPKREPLKVIKKSGPVEIPIP